MPPRHCVGDDVDAASHAASDAAKSLRSVLAKKLQWWDGHPRQRPVNGDRTTAGEGGTVPAKYVVTKSRGKFSYELKASNGQIVASGAVRAAVSAPWP